MANAPTDLQLTPTSSPRPAWSSGKKVKRYTTGRRLQRRNERIKQRDAFTCQNEFCGYVGLALHVDHIIPMSQGGAEDDEDNLQCLCVDCNQAKGWVESQGLQVDDPKFFDPKHPKRTRAEVEWWSRLDV